jgi:hypothetical protein
MPRPVVATGPDPIASESTSDVVRLAFAAAALLVGQHVAAKATRDAVFLSVFPVSALPLAAGTAAALSFLATLAVSRGMSRHGPPAVVRRLLYASSTLLAAEAALFPVAPRLVAAAVYVHVGVFGAIVVSGFWSVVNERFDPREARRVMGRIGSGASLGGVLGGLVTWRAGAAIGTPALLLMLSGLTVAAVPVLASLHRRPPASVPRHGEPPAPLGIADALGVIRRHSYLRDLAALVALVALTAALLDYVLSAAVTERFGRGPALVAFFSLYHTAVALLVFAAQSALAGRALERIGLAGTLALTPAFVVIGGLGAALWNTFWLRVGLRGLHAVFVNSMFRSGYELLYTPVDPQRKRSAKALLDVGADRLGTLAGSGAVLLALSLGPRSLRVLPVLASVVAAVTVYVARRLHRGYVGSLADSLRAGIAPAEGEDAASRFAVAAAPRPAPAPPAVEDGSLSGQAADLRSRDPRRVRGVLARQRALPAELVPLVIALLDEDELFADVVTALRRAAPRCTGQLLDVLLDPLQDPAVRRRVPRVLKAAPSRRAADGLWAAVQDERFDVRYRSAQALVRLSQNDRWLSPEPAGARAAALRELAGTASARGLDHVFTLLSLALPDEPLRVALRAWRSGDRALRGTALEYLENVLPSEVWAGLWPWLGARSEPSGRTIDEIRDDLLRSTASFTRGRHTTKPDRGG